MEKLFVVKENQNMFLVQERALSEFLNEYDILYRNSLKVTELKLDGTGWIEL